MAKKKQGSPELAGGLIIILTLVLLAAFAPMLTNIDPYATDMDKWLRPPSLSHFFGTDRLGRDVFTRVMLGARISLAVGFLAAMVSVGVGATVGAVSGYYGGWADQLLMRATDVLLVFPTLLLTLTLTALFEPSLWLVIAIIGGTGWPGIARLVRGEVLRLKNAEFIHSARLLGASNRRLVGVHLLPNALGQVLAAATLSVPAAIMTEAGLGYFGLGIAPPVPTWGNMLRDAQQYIRLAWWYATFPGMFIFLTVFGFQLTGEGLRKLAHPRQNIRRGRRA